MKNRLHYVKIIAFSYCIGIVTYDLIEKEFEMSEKEQLPKASTEPKEPTDHHKKRKIAIIITVIVCILIVLIVTLCSIFLAGGQPGKDQPASGDASGVSSAEGTSSTESELAEGGGVQKPVYIDPNYDGVTGGAGTQGSLEGGNTNGGTGNGENDTNNGQNNTTTAVGKVSLDAVDKKVLVGKTVTLTAEVYPNQATDKKLTWKSSNESVATVESGVVTGKSPGVAVITATTSNGKSSACVVTVRAKTAYDAPYDKDAIYADMVSYGIGKGFTLDTALSADSAEYFEEYTGDGWYQDAPESLWSKCAWMIDNAAQSVTSSTGSMDGHRFNILLKADNNGEYHIYVLYQ